MGTIQEWALKIKGLVDRRAGEWAAPFLVIFVGLASFGLGRLSAASEARPAISVREASAASEAFEMALGGAVVASRSGRTYHLPWCPGAESIKESNKIWFEDEAAAQKAGYQPAKNCQGLGE
jgi:hypothetical protein